MKEGLVQTKKIDTLKSEHLNDGVKPIIACLETAGQSSSPPEMPNTGIEFVDLYGDNRELHEQGFKKEGKEDYIISPINSNSKFSVEFADCTGIVAVGSEIISGNNISFMSHQNPSYFLTEKREKFIADLRERLEEIKRKSQKGTIDVVIFGGRYSKTRDFKESDPLRNIFIQEYIDSIKLLSAEINKELGFYPTVIVGPKLSPSEDSVAFNNENRRLYVTRSEKGLSSDFLQSFNAEDIEEVRKSWKPGEWGLPI